MAPGVEEMWSDIKSVVIEHVSQDSPDDYTLAEYLGRTVSRDYMVGMLMHFTCYGDTVTFMFSGLHDVTNGNVQTQVTKGKYCYLE